ncbi:hypothetical protein [Streptomyces sp. NPDC000880]
MRPGYFVLTASDREFQNDGGEERVEDEPFLRQFFEEARWVIEWKQ